MLFRSGCITALPGPIDESDSPDDMSGMFEDDGYGYEEPDDELDE